MTDDANILRMWCVRMHVMCQVMKLLTSRSSSRHRPVRTHLCLWQDFISNTSKSVYCYFCECFIVDCVCVASAAIFHPFWSPLRTCGTLCECVCVFVAVYAYVFISVPVCAHLHLLAAFIHYHGEQHGCVFGMYDESSHTRSYAHHATHTHTVCLIN